MTATAGEMEALSSITIAIPTVAGREQMLNTLLASVRNQPGGSSVHIFVSGNGTGEETQKIAQLYKAQFIQRLTRMTASDHFGALIPSVNTEFTWILGDDDILAFGALMVVAEVIALSEKSRHPLQAIIGRAQSFTRDDLSDLGAPNPEAAVWHSGEYSKLATVASATFGVAHIGAFIFRTDLFSLQNFNRYLGTSHEIFGAFWDGLAELHQPRVLVLDRPLVLLRQTQKEWDYSPLLTLAGLRRYDRLLPESVSKQRLNVRHHLSRRSALSFASTCEKAERPILRQYVSNFDSSDFLAVSLSRIPYPLARTLRLGYRSFRSLTM